MAEKKCLPAAGQAEDVELLTELNALRVENRWLARRAEHWETYSGVVLREQEEARAKQKKELRGMTAFVSVGCCLCAATVCWVAAPWWTAVTPMVLALAVMKKAGWI